MTKGTPLAIKQNKYGWLWGKYWRNMHLRNRMFSMCATGAVGSGKSYSMLSLAWLMDRDSDNVPRFSLDRVVFSANEFIDVVNSKPPKGSAIIIDDAGICMYSKDGMTREVKELSKQFMSIRHRNYCILLTLPNFEMLAKNVRQTLQSYCEIVDLDLQRQQTIARFHRLQTSPRTGKIYHKAPTKWVKQKHPGLDCVYRIKTKVPFVRFDKPDKELAASYEAKREKSMARFYEGSKERIAGPKRIKRKSFPEVVKKVRANIDKYLDSHNKVGRERIMLDGVSLKQAESAAKLLNEERKKAKSSP